MGVDNWRPSNQPALCSISNTDGENLVVIAVTRLWNPSCYWPALGAGLGPHRRADHGSIPGNGGGTGDPCQSSSPDIYH